MHTSAYLLLLLLLDRQLLRVPPERARRFRAGPLEPPTAGVAVELGCWSKEQAEFPRQRVHGLEADVVARPAVLGSGVPQANDEAGHGVLRSPLGGREGEKVY